MSDFPAHVTCETSLKTDGNMSYTAGQLDEVTQNRMRFLKKHAIAPQEHIPMRCDHTGIISVVGASHRAIGTIEPGAVLRSEVLITQEKRLALFLLTADCIPLSLYDPITQTIALAHISRKTLVERLPQKTAEFLRTTFAVNLEDLLVYIGPHIKKESYAFALPLAHVFPSLVPYTEEKAGFAHIDLQSATADALTQIGVAAANISCSPIDTAVSNDHFSFYSMKKNGEHDGSRMATILMME